VSTPLLENILAQPSALQIVADYQLGPGLATLRRCAELLKAAKRIVLTGMGASLFACGPMRYVLAGRGIDISVVETAELLHFLDALAAQGTVLVLVSRSGESIETVKLLERVRCKTIGVTNVPNTTLADRTSEHILLNSPSDQLVAVQTYIASVVTLLFLAAAYLDDLDSVKADLDATIHLLPAWIDGTISASKTWQSFINLTSSLYILGRGPGLPSVDEGVLLMHEVAKTPAVGMSVAQFRHGFVEAADKNIRAVIIGTQPATRQLDQQFAEDLHRMGAAVCWIGQPLASPGVMTLGHWQENVPARFASVFEVIPLQLLAYRAAESRGIIPGTFRWASTVTGSEAGFPGLGASHL
jgi:glucosamine--fructose-6-phosphate aminotransferase (isomerizing)